MTRRIVTVSAALVLALLGTLLVVAYVSRADARALEGIETVDVLVAAAPLSQGQSLQEASDAGLLETQTLPRKSVPAAALREVTPADAPLVLANDVTAGELLLRPRLVPTVAPDGDLVVPAGKLAVSVQLEDPARVGGYVRVGSQIAVYDSFNVVEGNEGAARTPSGDHLADGFETNKATRVLLPRIEVLAVGSQTVPVGQPGAPSAETGDGAPAGDDASADDARATLVTVAVEPAEAEKLVHGAQTGTLYLALLGDGATVEPGPGTDNRTLLDP